MGVVAVVLAIAASIASVAPVNAATQSGSPASVTTPVAGQDFSPASVNRMNIGKDCRDYLEGAYALNTTIGMTWNFDDVNGSGRCTPEVIVGAVSAIITLGNLEGATPTLTRACGAVATSQIPGVYFHAVFMACVSILTQQTHVRYNGAHACVVDAPYGPTGSLFVYITYVGDGTSQVYHAATYDVYPGSLGDIATCVI
jgi:hypothetical protein